MKVTLFGGAFDPPHLAHHLIARTLLQQHLANEVWFLPVKYHAFNKHLTAETHRLAMLQQLIADNMRIELFELQQPTTNYTYQTLKALQAKYPQHTFSFVIGSDNLKQFHTWDNFEQLVEQFTFFVYPRHGYPLRPLYENMTVLENVEEFTISSTLIKQLLKEGNSIAQLVPEPIAKYIAEHKLCQE